MRSLVIIAGCSSIVQALQVTQDMYIFSTTKADVCLQADSAKSKIQEMVYIYMHVFVGASV